MNRGLFGNNTDTEFYESGEIVFSATRPGIDWLRLDSTIYTENSKIDGTRYALPFNKVYDKHPRLRSTTLWTEQDAAMSNQTIQSIAYGNGLWVATGYNGFISTSTDAVTWVTRTSNFGTSIVKTVDYGNNVWVAGGNGGQIRTSTDGVTWVTQTSNFGTSQVTRVRYKNNLWVAVGAGGSIRTATDAVTWVTQTSNFGTTAILDANYGNGIWVASGNAGQLRTSTDAVTWVTQTSNFGVSNILSVNFGNGVWVATGQSAQFRRSIDGISWTTVTTNFASSTGVISHFDARMFIAHAPLTANYSLLVVSSDGTTWSNNHNFPRRYGQPAGFAYGGRRWAVAIGTPAKVLTAQRAIFGAIGTYPNWGWVKL